MLNNSLKKELREYFGIKNITISKKEDGFEDVNEYYEDLFYRRQSSLAVKNELERRKQQAIEQEEKENKRKLKNKLKKLRKRINKQAKQFSIDSDDDLSDDVDVDVEQVKPYIFFIPQIEKRFTENLYLIGLLNSYYEINENYRKFLLDNKYEKIKITKQLHTGYTDPLHFNGYFLTHDDDNISGCIHFYVEDDSIKKLSMIIEIM